MKYYLFDKKLPAVEIETAKILGADLAFCEKNAVLTVIYPVSDLGAEALSHLMLREVESQVFNPSYLIFKTIDQIPKFLRETHGLELEQVETQKTSQ